MKKCLCLTEWKHEDLSQHKSSKFADLSTSARTPHHRTLWGASVGGKKKPALSDPLRGFAPSVFVCVPNDPKQLAHASNNCLV